MNQKISVEEAAAILTNGGVVAAPTDTVYGLLTDATNPKAVERLLRAKGRYEEKSVSVFLERPEEIAGICALPPLAREFVNALLPGPYTVVLPLLPPKERSLPIAPELTPQESLGVRVISHPTILSLLEMVKRPLTATSANLSGMPSATRVDEISQELLGRIDGVIDGGRTTGGASTVISFVDGQPKVLREGKGLKAFRRWYEEH